MNKKFSLFFISILCVAFLAGKVLALEVTYPTIFDQSINSTSSAEDYVCYLFGLIMNLAFFVSVLVIVFGGLYYLASLSRGKFTDEGKSYIKSGIYGLLIVVCSALIIYTINPSLNKCSFGAMSLISDVVSEISDTSTTTQDVITFKEIPIGTLTENLLSRKIDCYAFDQNGNPVPGDGSTGDEIQPTLRNHDRADCITQLMEGAQNKANVIASLTKEINSLMEECRCDDSKCSPSNLACSEGSGCELLGQGVAYGSGGQCTSSGSCEGICCEENTGCTGQDCCDTETRDKIEGNNNSTISVSVQVGEGETEEVEYNGLNEFRCPNPDANGGYAECYNVASSGVERSAITKEGNPVSIINKKNWDKLSLIQQLSYFGEKLDYTNESSIGKMIDDDKDLLNEARETLSNCYLAISYIDLLKKRDSKKCPNIFF
jgi:hypothetical protein